MAPLVNRGVIFLHANLFFSYDLEEKGPAVGAAG